MAEEENLDRGDEIEEVSEETEETQETEGEEQEPEEEAAEEEEEAEEGEEAEEEEEPRIPKKRLDQVIQQRRALEERIRRMEKEREELLAQAKERAPEAASDSDEPSPEELLVELDEKINDALLDGDKALAKELRQQQRELERYLYQQELERTTQSAAAQAREQVRLDATIDFLESTYPQLNPESEEFNQNLVNELESLRSALERSGEYTPSQAVLAAAKYVLRPDAPEEPPAQPAPDKSKAVKKAVEAAKKQPPSLKDVGEDADKAGMIEEIDPLKLTEKDLETLPAATLAKLRGDVL